MIPKEIMKLYEKLAFSRGYEEAFRDFLDVCLYYLSVGMLAEDYRRVEKRYKPYEMELFVQMFYRVSEYSEGFCDVLGDMFMECVSHGNNGQFFTPPDICDLMVLCTDSGETATGKRICDPTCGSGRLLLAYHVRHLGNYLVAEDVNRTCCLMTVCNMLVHGCIGEVIHHDSLFPENFMDGWMVNHTLTQTGIPSIRRMSEEEYRTSRNMSVDLLRKRKEKLRQMQPDKKQLPYKHGRIYKQ